MPKPIDALSNMKRAVSRPPAEGGTGAGRSGRRHNGTETPLIFNGGGFAFPSAHPIIITACRFRLGATKIIVQLIGGGRTEGVPFSRIVAGGRHASYRANPRRPQLLLPALWRPLCGDLFAEIE